MRSKTASIEEVMTCVSGVGLPSVWGCGWGMLCRVGGRRGGRSSNMVWEAGVVLARGLVGGGGLGGLGVRGAEVLALV